MPDSRQTTATLQTPPGLGGIAVIGLRGPEARTILAQAFRPLASHADAAEGALQLGHVVDGADVIDEAIVTCRRGAYEINIHGGPAAARATLQCLARLGATVGSAPSAPDSFPAAHPRWNNPAVGREMLDTLPLARGTRAISAITAQWSAGLSELLRGRPTPERLRRAARHLATIRRLLDPAEVVLAGRPNVGKSTLANALVGRAVSIVHDRPGTTRDWVREPAILDGVPIYLTDTAGLWRAADEVDVEAVRRARQCIRQADLVVLLYVDAPPAAPDWLQARRVLRVAAKCDLNAPDDTAGIAVSAKTGQGLADLKKAIVRLIGLGSFDPAAPMAFTARQRDLLLTAADAMETQDAARAGDLLRELLEGPAD